MAEEMNRKDAAQEKLTDRNYVYVRYENDDDDEMDIYDIITLCCPDTGIFLIISLSGYGQFMLSTSFLLLHVC